MPWRTPLGGTLPCVPECPSVPPAAPGDQARALPRLQRPTPLDLLLPVWPLSWEGPLHSGASQRASSPEEQTRTGLQWQNSPPGDNETLGPLCPPMAPRREVPPTSQPGAAGGPRTCRQGYQGGEGFARHGVRPESAGGQEEAWVKRAVSAWRHQGCRAWCPRWVGTLTSGCASCFSQPKGMWWPCLPQVPMRAPEVGAQGPGAGHGGRNWPNHREVSRTGHVEARASWSVPLDMPPPGAGLPSPCCCVGPSLTVEGVELMAPSTPGGRAGRDPATAALHLLPLLSFPSCVHGRPLGSCHP